ncbi:GMC oxidoreductase [Truncatella angustata]|uniref:Long-chain-alcohol oxidase n=1 Tax=Truncatella angustata TaxID=152316 RepID=A0A9P8ZWX8_9PEZI|nr:GMC oxidoreductase [Truncatella angustata]KAH6652428.1 GMC oxidoreductase [Truncatella angustata]
MAITATAAEIEVLHIATPLPEPPSASFFNETQWRTLWALMDTVVPSVIQSQERGTGTGDYAIGTSLFEFYYHAAQKKMTSPPSREKFEAYLSEKPSANAMFCAHMTRTLDALPKEMRNQLGQVLNLLSTRLGSLPLTGYFTPFCELPGDAREKVLQSWSSSYFATLRGLFKSVTVLAKSSWVSTSPLFLELSGWKDLPDDYKPGKTPDYRFKQFTIGDKPEIIETDVVIVGSGCGGGVCAEVLANAGHRVVVVDKGYYFRPDQLPMKTSNAGPYLFDSGGIAVSDDGSLSVLSGSTWGGGGSVNWGVSLQTPQYVREEWAKKRGLPVFTSQEFQDAIDRVCNYMGVSDATVRQSHRGQILLDGAQKLGWKAKVTPHNSGNKDHHCGHCHLGCGSAGKQGPAVSWLPAAGRAGAEFIEGFQVENVTFDHFASGKRASGVVGKWISRDSDGGLSGGLGQRIVRDVIIRAKKVIVSGGSIWSPVILKKSGLGNPQIGRNLYMHPSNIVTALWKEDVNPWEGCAITSVCTSFEQLDNDGNGTKLEPLCMVPSVALPQFQWRSGMDFKMSALRYRNMNAFFSMVRDRDTGFVYPDPSTGKPRIVYTPSAFDRANALAGVIGLARICYVMGAEEIRPTVTAIEPFMRTASDQAEAEDARFEDWIKRLQATGISETEIWGCAHQMGTCRMSKNAEDGVVDPNGKVWGVEDLYVADASVFPSASGVNPMITNMAISHLTAKGIAADLNTLKRERP